MSGACRNSSDNGPGVCSCCAGREMGSGMTWGHSQLPGRGAALLVCWGQSWPWHSSPCIRVLCQPAPMGPPQPQPAPCCRAGLLPREGSLPVPLGSHAGSSSTKSITHGSPPGAPPAPSRPRSAWCNSRSRSRSSCCWDAAQQELIPLIPVLGYSTAGADPVHPAVGMLHGRSRSHSPPCRDATPSPWSCRPSG